MEKMLIISIFASSKMFRNSFCSSVVNPLLHRYSFWRIIENIVGKEEIARNEQFLLFQQCFLLNQITVSPFVHIFDIISLFATELEEPKIGISGNGLKDVTACAVKS